MTSNKAFLKLKVSPKNLVKKVPRIKGFKNTIHEKLRVKEVPIDTSITDVQIKGKAKKKYKKKQIEEDSVRGKKLGDLSLKISSISALSGILYLLVPVLWPLLYIWMFGSVVGFFLGWGALRKRKRNNLNAVIGLVLGSGVVLFFLLIGIFVLLYLTSGFGVTS